MKYADMEAQWAAQKAADEEARRQQWAVIQRDPDFAALAKALRATFGVLTLDSLAETDAEGATCYLLGASPEAMAAQAGEWIEPWDRNCWGFGMTPEELEELQAKRARALERDAKRKSSAPGAHETPLL